MSKVNPFSNFSAKEQQERERTKRDIDRAAKESFTATASCLSSEQFAKYREKYQQGKEELINTGIGLVFDDPVSYAMAAHAIFMRLEFLGKLEDFIQKDLRKGK